jgi:hypothetical protein
MPISKILSDSFASGVGGKVLQVVAQTGSFSGAISSLTTYVDLTNGTLTITPTSATSKILVIAGVYGTHQGEDVNSRLRVTRDGTELRVCQGYGGNGGGNRTYCGFGLYFLDAPASTSQLTYKAQMSLTNDGGIGYSNLNLSPTSGGFTLMEVAG